MDTIDIVLVIVFILIILKLYSQMKPNKTMGMGADSSSSFVENMDNMDNVSDNINNTTSNGFKYRSNNLNKVTNEIRAKKSICNKNYQRKLNPYILDTKFHTDYRDVQSSLNDFVPSQKQIFNIQNAPIKYTRIDPITNTTVNYLVKDFLLNLNANLADVSDYKNSNSGWDDLQEDPQIKSGWDKAQNALGLQPSLYEKPAGKAPIRLIRILKGEKYETEDEIKYLIGLVIQKDNTDDQMLLKCSFIIDKSYSKKEMERNFNEQSSRNNKVLIEDLNVIGFLSAYGEDHQTFNENDDFYHFEQLENSEMIDNADIARVLMDKYKEKQKESQYRISQLDIEGRAIYNVPSLADSNSYQATTTILSELEDPTMF